MAEDEDGGGLDNEEALDAELEGATKGKKKLLIIIIVVLLILIGGAAAYFLGVFDSAEEEEVVEHAEVLEDDPALAEEGKGEDGSWSIMDDKPVYYDLPEFLVNLQTGSGRVSFLKATITLEAPNEEVVRKISSVQPRIIDSFNTYLRELRSSDLSGSAGMYRLREEMLLRVNKAIYPEKINDILFKEIVVQ